MIDHYHVRGAVRNCALRDISVLKEAKAEYAKLQ
jgi:hypothetical protein